MTGGWEYAAVRAGSVLAVLVLGATGCGDGAVGGSDAAQQSRVESEAGEVACGRPFTLPASGGLLITGRFADSVPAGQQTLRGTVQVTSRDTVRGVAAPAADLFLVREGRVVAMPPAQDAIGVRLDLAAGETREMAATAALASCKPEGGPLAPGGYELYARVVLTADDGAAQRAFGGPWRLRLR